MKAMTDKVTNTGAPAKNDSNNLGNDTHNDEKLKFKADDKIRFNPKDAERFTRIMAERKADADSVPLTNEEQILQEAEELRKKKELLAIQHKTINKPENPELLEKDRKTLEQIQTLQLKQLQIHEQEMEREKGRRNEELKKAEDEIKARKQKEAQLVEELRLKAATKDQMRLAVLAAKKKAEEEGLEFNETEFTVKLIMAKRKEDQEQAKLRGKKSTLVGTILEGLTPVILESSNVDDASASESHEAATDAVGAEGDSQDTNASSSPDYDVTSPPRAGKHSSSASTVELPSNLIRGRQNAASNNSNNNQTASSVDATKKTEDAAAAAGTGSGPSPKRLSDILHREKPLSPPSPPRSADENATTGFLSELKSANKQAEETRMMMLKMSQRNLDKEAQEMQRILQARAEREAQLAAEQERLANLAMLGKAADVAMQEVQAFQQRMEAPQPQVQARQAERARLIAEAKAKAAQEKNARKKKEEGAKKPVKGGIIILDDEPLKGQSSHESIGNSESYPPLPPPLSPVFTSDDSHAESSRISKRADEIVSITESVSVVKLKKENKPSASAKMKADALLIEARQKGLKLAAEEARMLADLPSNMNGGDPSESNMKTMLTTDETDLSLETPSVDYNASVRGSSYTASRSVLGASSIYAYNQPSHQLSGSTYSSAHGGSNAGSLHGSTYGSTHSKGAAVPEESEHSDGIEYSVHTDALTHTSASSIPETTPALEGEEEVEEDDEEDEAEEEEGDDEETLQQRSSGKIGFWESLFTCAPVTENSNKPGSALS